MKKILTMMALFLLAGCTNKEVTLEQKKQYVNDFIQQTEKLNEQSVMITTTTSYNNEKSVYEDYYYVEDTKDYLQIGKSYDEDQQLFSLKFMIHDPQDNLINMYQGFINTKVELFNSVEAESKYFTIHEFSLDNVDIDYGACTKDGTTTTIHFSRTQEDPKDSEKTITNYFVIEATSKNDQLTKVITSYYVGSEDNFSTKTERIISYDLPDRTVLKEKINSCIDQKAAQAITILES